MATRLKEKYLKEVLPALQQKFGFNNSFAAPRLVKVVLNMGVGIAAQTPKELDEAIADLSLIAGQKAVKTYAKKSIATFKIRQGQAIGCKVILRGDQMYEFLDKLFNLVLPRVRDFKGVSTKSFDRQGNYTLGVREQSIFIEIDATRMTKVRSLEITLDTGETTVEAAREMLKLLGMPFSKQEVA